MQISNISVNLPKYQVKKAQNINKNATVSFQSLQQDDAQKRAAMLGMAAAMAFNMAGCYNQPVNVQVQDNQQVTLETLGTQMDMAEANAVVSPTTPAPISNKTPLADVGFVSMPVTEFYFTNGAEEVILFPNKDLPRNDAGAVIVTIHEGDTLDDVINYVYSDALSLYGDEDRLNIRNKMIDETIQSL